jgi:putative ABC transport system ATP-binding protein
MKNHNDNHKVISCKNVWKIYNQNTPAEVQALRGVNLDIKKGEMVGIIGSSGSGKSTLLNIIGALDKPTKGKIFIDGEDIQNMNENQLADLRRKKIGFVFQFFNLIGSLTSLQNVELPMIFNGMPQSQRRKRAKELLTEMDLGDKISQRPTQLSGGQTQRVAVARALANDPPVILADEPTGNLDSKSGQNIIEIFKKLNKDNRTIIIVTHDSHIAKEAGKIVRVSDGKVVEEFI